MVFQQGQERVEANNEQRLPLKKRHYHISTAATNLQPTNSVSGSPQADSTVAAVDCTKKPLDRTGTQEKEKPVPTATVSIAGKNQGKPSSEKPPVPRDKGSFNSNSGNTASGVSNSEVKSKPIVDLPRNSIDEAIEACITRYTATSPPVETTTPAVHTVIATPKKRHRLETAAAAAGLVGKSPCASLNKSKEGSSESSAVANNKLSSVAVTTPPPSKRTVSRSASLNSATVVPVSCDSSVSADTSKTSQLPDSSVNSGLLELKMDVTVPTPTTAKVSTSTSKVTSSCKTSPPSSRSASQISKAVSPPSKVSTSSSKTSVTATKPSASTSSKLSSPSKVSAANNKVTSPVKQSSPVTRVTSSTPSKVSAPASITTTKVSSSSSNKTPSLSSSTKTVSPSNKTLVPVSKTTTSPKSAAVSSKVTPSTTVVTVSAATVTTTTTTAATMAATTVVTVATTTTTTVSTTSTVSETVLSSRLASMPVHHNLRLKRGSAVGDKDDVMSRRGVGKKKKLIRDVRVHVTKLSPTDFLLKKHVGAGKQRVRRRKAINRTGFPIKKKKKKQLCLNNSPVPIPLSTPVITVDVKKNVSDDATPKTATQDSGVKEILNNSATKRRSVLLKKERNSRISETRPKDKDDKGKVDVKAKGAVEKKPVETVSRESRQTVNGKRDAVRLANAHLEDIPLKERREMTDAKATEEKDSKANNKEDSMEVVGSEVACFETKESQASSKQKVESGQDRSKVAESCNVAAVASDAVLPVSSAQTPEVVEKDFKEVKLRKRRRDRDSSKDDAATPLPLSAKRMKKCRDEDIDHDDR